MRKVITYGTFDLLHYGVHFKNYIRSTISPHCGTSNYWRADL